MYDSVLTQLTKQKPKAGRQCTPAAAVICLLVPRIRSGCCTCWRWCFWQTLFVLFVRHHLIWGSVADFVNLMEVGQTRSRYAHHGAPARLWWCK